MASDCGSLPQPMLDPVIHKMITYVQNLEEKDLKDKVEMGHTDMPV